MKNILILLLILATSLFAKVEWSDMFDAYDDAATQNKIVMVMLSREGCPGCEYMKTVVFEDATVSKLLKKNFISVELDVSTDFVPQNLEYFATPTFYFLDAHEKILKRVNGGEKAKDFLKTLKALKK
ncbi:thioredoxin fold domain-containing protein [Sulfurimonas sp. SAG-AH-194-C20]|nr:thioredoxin fold domain-containing protein [Sulfurimonas sp. SAG-AH-194-C20]MDF1878884.1 thioredoxin fold domain-containing protein [Sulfurimonas sp. SAG-AH-194-C20]